MPRSRTAGRTAGSTSRSKTEYSVCSTETGCTAWARRIVSGPAAAEFPTDAHARAVLGTIGSGERTFTNIGREAGDLNQSTLDRALKLLVAKRIVAADQPLSTKKPADKRYRVADPYLRFWLAFVGPHIAEVERGRGDRVLSRIQTSWLSWRGRAIEPVLLEALDRLAVPVGEGETGGVLGAYWTRSNNPEIDIVIADRAPIATRILALGSIKWLESSPFDAHDYSELLVQRTQLPGAAPGTPLVVVSRSGSSVEGVRPIGPEELLSAWRG